jgi:hypothetical protein
MNVQSRGIPFACNFFSSSGILRHIFRRQTSRSSSVDADLLFVQEAQEPHSGFLQSSQSLQRRAYISRGLSDAGNNMRLWMGGPRSLVVALACFSPLGIPFATCSICDFGISRHIFSSQTRCRRRGFFLLRLHDIHEPQFGFMHCSHFLQRRSYIS